MSRSKSILRVAGLSLGGIGIVLCVGSIVALWILSAYLGLVIDNGFSQMDRSLIVVRDKVVQAEDRVAAAAISSTDIEQSLLDWTKREAEQRAALQLRAVEHAERIAAAVQQADHWLEISQLAVERVQEILSLAGSTSMRADTTSVGPLLEEIAALQSQLTVVTDVIAKIHLRIAEMDEEKPIEVRVDQAVQFALRLIATLRLVESRLASLLDRIAAAQSTMQDLRIRVRRWILAATIGVTALILWMTAGQAALCRLSWSGWQNRLLR